jgi:hypothetical protein
VSEGLRYCWRSGWLVGPGASIPEEPEEFTHPGMLERIGCNRLVCKRCRARVREGVGFLACGGTRAQLEAAHAAPDWTTAPGLASGTAQAARSRLYLCRCDAEPVEAPIDLEAIFTTAEGEEYRTPPWACAGHPRRRIPFELGGIRIEPATSFAELVPRCFSGWAPEGARERERAEPAAWLHRLYASLLDTGLEERVARAVAPLLDGEDRALLRGALGFYRSFPEAPGFERVLALWDRARQGVLAEVVPGDAERATFAGLAFEALAAGAARGDAGAIARIRALLGGSLDDLVPLGPAPSKGRGGRGREDRGRAAAREASVERLGGRLLRLLAERDQDWLAEHVAEVARAAVRSGVVSDPFDVLFPISVAVDRRLDEMVLSLVAEGIASRERAAEFAHTCMGAHPRRHALLAALEVARPVDFGGARITPWNVEQIVRNQVTYGTFTRRDDRTWLDWIRDAHDACAASPRVREALSRALGGWVGAGGETTSLVARFFGDRQGIPGGEAVVEEALLRLERYPAGAPDPLEGGVAATLRCALLKAAAQWSEPLPDALRDVLRREVMTDDGARALLGPLWRRDRAWVEAHLDAILAAQPTGAHPAFIQMVLGGTPPAAALRTVLSKVTRADVESLEYAVRRHVEDPAEAADLLAQIRSLPPL